MLDSRSTRPRWTIGRMMLAVAALAVLLALPATFGPSGSIVLGCMLGASGAAVVPAMLVCKVQSRFPSRRDAASAWLLAESALIFDALAWAILAKFGDVGMGGGDVVVLVACVAGYVAFLMAAVAGLIELPPGCGPWSKVLSVIVVLSTLPFAFGVGIVCATVMSGWAW